MIKTIPDCWRHTYAHEERPLGPVVWDAEGVGVAPGLGQEAADERCHQRHPGHVEHRHVGVLRSQLAHAHLRARAAQSLRGTACMFCTWSLCHVILTTC